MKRILLILIAMAPMVAYGYGDHRGRNLDSLERVLARYTPDRLAVATAEEKADYVRTCREMAWGYLQLDGPKSMYYARQAIRTGRELDNPDAVFDMSILIGQIFWAREQYDSARVYYGQAGDALALIEARWDKPDRHDLEASQSRLWGTLGNFYAMQDSLEQFASYCDKAGAIFEKWGWWEDASTLHYNIGEVYLDAGDPKTAKPAYERALELARRSGDSLIIARAMYGLGRWYKESGRTAKALKYLVQADEYYGNHPREEVVGRADTLDVMNAAHKQLYRNARLIAVGAVFLLALAIAAYVVSRRLRRTRQTLSETEAVLDETIEELRPTHAESERLTEQEEKILRLLARGQTTPQIAEQLCLSYNTVLWYRKRLHAKLDVHTTGALVAEAQRRGLL